MSSVSGIQTGGLAMRDYAQAGLNLVDDGANDVTAASTVDVVLLANAKMKQGGTQATLGIENHKNFTSENSDALKAAARASA